MKSWTRVLCVLAVGLLLLSLSAVYAVAADPIVVWCEPQKVATIRAIADEWTKTSGRSVSIESVGVLETADRIALAGPMGKGPDVFCSLSGKLGILTVTGMLSPIDRTSIDASKFMKVGLDGATVDGKLYGVPYDISTIGLIYNKKIWPTPPATMDEMISRSKELLKKGMFGVLWPMENFYYAYPFMNAYGGYVFTPTANGWDAKNIGLANAGSVKALKLLKVFRDEGLIPVGTDYVAAPAKFTEGKAAAIVDGPWIITNVKQAGIDYGVAPLPKLDNGKYPSPFVSLKWWHVSSYSKNKADAVKLIAYLTSRDAMLRSFRNAEGIPPRLDVLDTPEAKNSPEVVGFGAQADYGCILPDIPEMNAVWVPMNNAIDIVLRNQNSPDRALADAVTLIKEANAELK
ncbi:MAG: maltose ABC transporter substrate-binding protein [Clostridia bacterium]|nr:maltose ABC transporter substrate-binding protein [Clostridia bacterium]